MSYRDRISGPRPYSRLALLAGAPALLALWLYLAAIPALADGGPHVMASGSGAGALTSDACAGCHRAHTAQGERLLDTDVALCLTCHGAQSAGATTDVMTGVQYVSGAEHDVPNGDGQQLGALRNGGFVQARIASGSPSRWLTTNTLSEASHQRATVRVGPAADVTSAHLPVPGSAINSPGIAWGNGANGSGPGPTVDLGCTSCHNPHGNGQYRILIPIPNPGVLSGTFTPVAAPGAIVTDSPIDPDGDPSNGIENPTKNYTVLQVKGVHALNQEGTVAANATYLLYLRDVMDARSASPTKTWPAGSYGSSGGDYWHVRVPWNSSSGANDAPNGIPSNSGALVAFDTQMTAWCSACHTRQQSATAEEPSGDSLYAYRHETIGNRACTTCHVAHGSNARMEGPYSKTMPFPDDTTVTYSIGGTTTGDSRLLKVDNRGTCQLCHDPTYTEPAGQYRGPLPTPGIP
jgi:predicted CXXCH cytochrome family protein